MKLRVVLLFVTVLLCAGPSCMTGPQPDNTLSFLEKFSGWQLLFDGHSFNGLRAYRQKGPPTVGWEIKDVLLQTVPLVLNQTPTTEKKFTDFEFRWEWRVAIGGNNGIKYCVT